MGRDEGEVLGGDSKVDQYTPGYSDWLTHIKSNLLSYGVSAGAIAGMDDYENNLGTKTVSNVLATKTDVGGLIIYHASDSGYFGLDDGTVFEAVEVSTADIDAVISCIEDN